MLIPTIPLSFHTLTINRRDGTCTAHYRKQVNFVQIIQSNKVNTFPEINQNITESATISANDQMSRSMHEARNQIFEQQENQLLSEQQRKRRLKEVKLAGVEKPQPQIAFALDSLFNVLWVFDGGLQKFLCYNVIASDIVENGPVCFCLICVFALSIKTVKPKKNFFKKY